MKTQEELNELKRECKEIANKLQELSEEELNNVIGGVGRPQSIAYLAKMFTPADFSETVKAMWGISGVITNCKLNEDDSNQDEIAVYRAIK